MQIAAGKRNWQDLARAMGGLLLAAGVSLASLWIIAPRLAERKIRAELVRCGVAVPDLRVRSLTPWALELEPLRLGTEPDAPTIGALGVTYAPRELLRGKVRTLTLDGARFVVRRGQSGGWEVAGLDQLLPRRASAATSQPTPIREWITRLPDNMRLTHSVLVVDTGPVRLEFPLRAEFRKTGDGKLAGHLSTQAFGRTQTAAVTVAAPAAEEVWSAGLRLRLQLPPPPAIGGVSFSIPPKLECVVGVVVMNSDNREGRITAELPAGTLKAEWRGGFVQMTEVEAMFRLCWRDGTVEFPSATLKGSLALAHGGFQFAVPRAKLGLSSMLVWAWSSPDTPLRPSRPVIACSFEEGSLHLPQAQLAMSGFCWKQEFFCYDGKLRSLPNAAETSDARFHAVSWRGMQLGELPLQITAGGKTIRVEAAVKPPGSALSATVALSASLETQEVALSAIVPPTALAEKDPLLAPFLPAALTGARFSGMVGGRADVTWKPGGEPQGTAVLTLADGKFALADGTFDAAGVEGGLTLESLAPLRSAPRQKLKFALAHVAGTPLTDGKLTFRLDSPDTIFIEHGSFGWCGGKLSGAAVRITGGKPDGMVMLRAEQVDVGDLLGRVKDFGGHAEGWLSGKIPLLFGPGGVRLGEAHLFTDPDKPGRLQLDPEKWPGNQVETLGASPTVKKAMQQTLRDMNLHLLRLDALPGNGTVGTRLCLRIAGTPRQDGDLPPVDLTLNLNLEGNRLWDLLNRSIRRP